MNGVRYAIRKQPLADILRLRAESDHVLGDEAGRVERQGLAIADKKMAPSLAGSKVAIGEPAAFALAVLKGIQKDPANLQILGIMAPLEMALDDEKLAGVMTYVRNSFGNSASV